MQNNNISNFNSNLNDVSYNMNANSNLRTGNNNNNNSDSNGDTQGPLVSTTGKGEVLNPGIKRSVNNELDKDAFLKLLVTQLKYQDPLQPMDNTQFIAQTAQFTALEQMQNLNATMTNSQAFSLIGKPVYVETENEQTGTLEALSGVVSSVEVVAGKPYVNIGNKKVPFADVKLVGGMESDNSGVISQAMSLIGKTIQGILMDEDLKNAIGYIEGKVDFVKFVDGSPILSVNGKEVNLYEVAAVSESTLLLGQEISVAGKDGAIIKGNISDINIKNVTEGGKNVSKLYIKVDDKEYEIKDINSLTSSFALVGKEINADGVSGKVDGVIIRDSKPYLIVGDKEVSYEDAK